MEPITQHKIHLSAGDAEITVLEREAGFTAIVGTQAGPVGFVEVEAGTPAAGLIDPVDDQLRHSLHVNEQGHLVLSTYDTSGGPVRTLRLYGNAGVELDGPALIGLKRGSVWIDDPQLPLAILSFDGRRVGSVAVQAGGDVVSLIGDDDQLLYSLFHGNDGTVALLKHDKGEPVVLEVMKAQEAA